MKTITLDIRSHKKVMADAIKTLQSGIPNKSARFSFASPEQMWDVLNSERWQIIKLLCKAGPIPPLEIATRLNRDIKAVHSDIDALLAAGVVDRKEGNAISFPYQEIKLDFTFTA